jgi:hypothetical protein
MKKTCFKCKKEKALVNFYKHSKMSDGHLNKCKDCTKADSLSNRSKNIDYYRSYDRKRADLPHRKKLRKEVAERWKSDPQLKKRRNKLQKGWQERNLIKRSAHIITGNAIRDGKLIKKPCEVCGKKKVDAHHDDYNKPLIVRWLCRKHHMEHHKKERAKK